MNRVVFGALMLTAAFVLGGCEDTRRFVGMDRDPPDEFAVYSRAPLSLPPDYGLRPPAPGTARPQRVMPVDDAKKAIVGGRQAEAPPAGQFSPGTTAFLKQIGAYETDPTIRVTINRETAAIAEEERSVADKILFWRDHDGATVVDPGKEAQRIRENQALGKSLTDGKTPVIERKEKGLLEGIF